MDLDNTDQYKKTPLISRKPEWLVWDRNVV